MPEAPAPPPPAVLDADTRSMLAADALNMPGEWYVPATASAGQSALDVTVEAAIEDIGGFGKYQQRLFKASRI
jgi:hypothetical protein